jgi:hypothetical protein
MRLNKERWTIGYTKLESNIRIANIENTPISLC